MSSYETSILESDFASLLDEGPISLGSIADLAHFAARLVPINAWVHSMEVFELLDGGDPLRLEFSMLGLDGEDDWPVPHEPTQMRALLGQKIDMMLDMKTDFYMQVWMG
jgi:hypothetical protein